MRSKAHWGYDEAFMASCADELAVRPRHLTDGITRMACIDGRAVAYGRVCGTGEDAELDALFVDPHYIGAGIGRRLLSHLTVLARAAGIRQLEIASDPGARGFYESSGAVQVGEIASGSISGRTLPLMRLPLL